MKLLFVLLSVLRVALVGDPQVDNEKELGYARKTVYSELRARTDIDLIIVLGDLVNEKPALIAPSEALLDSTGVPWARVNGNHDGPNPARDTSFVCKGTRFILMNDIRRISRGGYTGGISAQQKEWLRGVLAESPADEPVVVCTHIPITQCDGADTLKRLLAVREKLLLVAGHLHNVDRRTLDWASEELVAGAACGMWWRGRKDEAGIPYALQNCGAPKGYFTADFRPNKQQWYTLEYKPLSRKDQMSATREGDNLVVNVFGGSPAGVVEVKVGSRWLRAVHSNRVAPEALEVIEWNKRVMTREYRKAHRDEWQPMRTHASSHIWVLPGISKKGLRAGSKSVRIRYTDPAMRVEATLPI